MDAGSLGPDIQTKSTTTLSDLLSLCTGRALKKPASQLMFAPDNQSDCAESNDMSVNNQTWHDTQSDMPNSHILNSALTKEKSSVQNLGTTVNKVEDSNPKKVDYIDEKLYLLFVSLRFSLRRFPVVLTMFCIALLICCLQLSLYMNFC